MGTPAGYVLRLESAVPGAGNGTFLSSFTTLPSFIQIMSKGIAISFIQKVGVTGLVSNTKSIPVFSAKDDLPLRPLSLKLVVLAISTVIVLLPTVIDCVSLGVFVERYLPQSSEEAF